MNEMRILTVRQPWAFAIAYGFKDVENRVRNLTGGYRGPVAIHAGAVYDKTADSHPEVQRLARRFGVESMSDHLIAFGQRAYRHIIGVVDLVEMHYADDCWERDKQRLIALYRSGPEGRAEVAGMPDDGPGGIIGKTRFCSPWAQDGAHHLALANPRPLAESIPFKGALGLRRLDEATTASVWAQIGENDGND